MQRSEFKIVICGGGLAGLMTVLALRGALSSDYQITLIDEGQDANDDIVYGSVTLPTAYDFLRGLGLDEPFLFSRSATSFSFGTHYVEWPGTEMDWVQCHHQILPLIAGIPLQHHLTRNQQRLAPLLVSGVAARQGKFAHPPDDPSNPLSRAEYGYQFSVREWVRLLAEKVANTNVLRHAAEITSVQADDSGVSYVDLASGETLSADLFIDCTGPRRKLTAAANGAFSVTRKFSVAHSVQPTSQLGPPCRRVTASPNGWSGQTYLQNAVHTLSVQTETGMADAITCMLGSSDAAWKGNVVSIGAAASVLDPLTPGPMVMLQRDIERLLDLIPVARSFEMEQREFNRRFKDDVAHTNTFADAFYLKTSSDTPFWTTAEEAARTPDLVRKITQFESRGVLAKYDLEPYNDEDWTILHHGLGRRATRYDLQTEGTAKPDIDEQLNGMSRAIEQLVARMPPHHVYVTNMKRYFEKQNYA